MSLSKSARYWRSKYLRRPSKRALKFYLRAKGRMGRYDSRMNVNGVPLHGVTASVKRFLARGYAFGLVATATTNGQHAPGSYHDSGRAGDLGVVGSLVGTAEARRRLEAFQRSEYRRRVLHRQELIGPINGLIVLRGRKTSLAEGTALENAHDNHVHSGFSR